MTTNTVAEDAEYRHREYGDVTVFQVSGGIVYFGPANGLHVRCDSVGNFVRDCRQI